MPSHYHQLVQPSKTNTLQLAQRQKDFRSNKDQELVNRNNQIGR